MMATPEVAQLAQAGDAREHVRRQSDRLSPGLAAVETIEQEGLLARGKAVGERFRGHFQALRDERPDLVREIRILGVMIGTGTDL